MDSYTISCRFERYFNIYWIKTKPKIAGSVYLISLSSKTSSAYQSNDNDDNSNEEQLPQEKIDDKNCGVGNILVNNNVVVERIK